MPDDSIERVLEKFFPPSAATAWKKIASKEIGEKDPFEFLSWRGKDGLLFLPYYGAEHVAKLKLLNNFQTPAPGNSVFDAKSWINLPEINSADETNANSLALEHLSSGADGVLFHLRKAEHIDLHALLRNIQWPHCFLAFHIHDDASSSNLSDYIRNHYDPASVSGALFWESIPKTNILEFYVESCENIKTLGIVIPSSTPAAEIAWALVTGITLWETCSAGFDPAKVLRSIAFSMSADERILETVAKVRALRALWMRVAHAYGMDDYKAGDLHIHARSFAVDDNRYAPHENMLKGTYSAMAAVLGGCDSLTVMSLDAPLGKRWARNVSSILREESSFSVNDPTAGSYALDSITDNIARKAWEIFQRQMSAAS